MSDESVTAEGPMSNGKYRWCFVSPGGATHYGAAHYKQPGSAVAAGRRWVQQEWLPKVPH